MHTLVILGAGKIGRMVAHLMATCGDYDVRLGDVAPGVAEAVAKRYGNVNDANGADFFAKALEEINEYECEKLWRKASKQEKESKKTAA